MGEEAFDEVTIPCEDGMVLHVTGGYGRNVINADLIWGF